jgi:general secretion pathway protein A
MSSPLDAPVALYAQFFGLRREPFSIAPDPRYLFMTEQHREALAHLLYGVKGGGGFVLLTGEIGAGKTTVCRCFLEQVPREVNIAYVLNPRQTVDELLESICQEYRIPMPPRAPGSGLKPLVDALNHYLLQTHALGQSNVLIIDEAQNLSVEVLEQLRLLTNLETAERKLLQIILIGQPELRDMLETPQLEQMAQRVIARYHLRALTAEDSAMYVRHRLEVAGLPGALPFNAEALALVHEVSRGVPRRINLVCDRALLGAYAKGRTVVDTEIVERSAVEVFGRMPDGMRSRAASLVRRREQRRRLTLLLAGLLLGGGLVALAAWWWAQQPGRAAVSIAPTGKTTATNQP